MGGGLNWLRIVSSGGQLKPRLRLFCHLPEVRLTLLDCTEPAVHVRVVFALVQRWMCGWKEGRNRSLDGWTDG
jgi:hypothetical protein